MPIWHKMLNILINFLSFLALVASTIKDYILCDSRLKLWAVSFDTNKASLFSVLQIIPMTFCILPFTVFLTQVIESTNLYAHCSISLTVKAYFALIAQMSMTPPFCNFATGIRSIYSSLKESYWIFTPLEGWDVERLINICADGGLSVVQRKNSLLDKNMITLEILLLSEKLSSTMLYLSLQLQPHVEQSNMNNY